MVYILCQEMTSIFFVDLKEKKGCELVADWLSTSPYLIRQENFWHKIWKQGCNRSLTGVDVDGREKSVVFFFI